MEHKEMDFLTMYDLGLKRKRWNCVTLAMELLDRGRRISARSLQRYRTGEMFPTQETAELIMKALDVEATPDEIAKSLAISKKARHAHNPNDDKYIQRGLRLRIKKLSTNPDEDEASIQLRLKRRIQEVETTRPTMNRYVTDLIRADLENHILALGQTDTDEGDEDDE